VIAVVILLWVSGSLRACLGMEEGTLGRRGNSPVHIIDHIGGVIYLDGVGFVIHQIAQKLAKALHH